VRPLLDALYTPPAAARLPADDVIVCRCEEVTAGDIRRIARQGCMGPNQMKAFSRCGMGPCQGRWCGTTVGELIADAQKRTPADVGYYRVRAPVKPVTISQLAQAVPVDTDVERGEFPS
jgi:bacterioferritin-associated ferredoxin